ncbi:C163A protein, partial [Crypturellus soui]|nr:C163A protein [Crypturellus soui]
RCAGRVEVKHEGQWGTVCCFDFEWDTDAASVVCRQLGCGAAARTTIYTLFGAGAGQIWLHPNFCRGHERALHDCSHMGWGHHDYDHDTDVEVTCSGEGLCDHAGDQHAAPSCPVSTSDGDAGELCLVNGVGPCEGRVEVKLRGQWRTIADDEWDMEDTEVVCQQLSCG